MVIRRTFEEFIDQCNEAGHTLTDVRYTDCGIVKIQYTPPDGCKFILNGSTEIDFFVCCEHTRMVDCYQRTTDEYFYHDEDEKVDIALVRYEKLV